MSSKAKQMNNPGTLDALLESVREMEEHARELTDALENCESDGAVATAQLALRSAEPGWDGKWPKGEMSREDAVKLARAISEGCKELHDEIFFAVKTTDIGALFRRWDCLKSLLRTMQRIRETGEPPGPETRRQIKHGSNNRSAAADGQAICNSGAASKPPERKPRRRRQARPPEPETSRQASCSRSENKKEPDPEIRYRRIMERLSQELTGQPKWSYRPHMWRLARDLFVEKIPLDYVYWGMREALKEAPRELEIAALFLWHKSLYRHVITFWREFKCRMDNPHTDVPKANEIEAWVKARMGRNTVGLPREAWA